jgi:hypothetical protein
MAFTVWKTLHSVCYCGHPNCNDTRLHKQDVELKREDWTFSLSVHVTQQQWSQHHQNTGTTVPDLVAAEGRSSWELCSPHCRVSTSTTQVSPHIMTLALQCITK